MRSLRVTLFSNHAAVLPIAYNELVQGLLYSCWRDSFPQLHDMGAFGVKAFRPFTFSRLEGTCSIDRKSRIIVFNDTVSFEVRSPVETLLDELATQLASRSSIHLGANNFELINMECRDRLLFPPQAFITFKTPVVCYTTTDDGHTHYYAPTDAEWLELVQTNTRRKIDALKLECPDNLQVILNTESVKKQVTRFKGTYITGWTGECVMVADPRLISTLWCLGIGSKNSQGFGMFSIHDKRLFSA